MAKASRFCPIRPAVTVTGQGPGCGYTSTPTVTFSNGGGTGAAATASINLASINVSNGGTGYTGSPTVVFSAGNANATASLSVKGVTRAKVTLENLFATLETSTAKVLKVVVKADTQGSVEAIVEELKKKDDAWLLAIDPEWSKKEPLNTYWKWFHVCEHESNHRGQIAWLKGRLPGAKAAKE